MKKFKFTLEKFKTIKINHQDSLKQTIENVDKKIREINDILFKLDEALHIDRQKFETDCVNGTTTNKLRMYDAYFKHVYDEKKVHYAKLAELQAQADELRFSLVVVNNEIKILDKKREEQYKEFLEGVAVEEATELDNFISFKICSP